MSVNNGDPSLKILNWENKLASFLFPKSVMVGANILPASTVCVETPPIVIVGIV